MHFASLLTGTNDDVDTRVPETMAYIFMEAGVHLVGSGADSNFIVWAETTMDPFLNGNGFRTTGNQQEVTHAVTSAGDIDLTAGNNAIMDGSTLSVFPDIGVASLNSMAASSGETCSHGSLVLRLSPAVFSPSSFALHAGGWASARQPMVVYSGTVGSDVDADLQLYVSEDLMELAGANTDHTAEAVSFVVFERPAETPTARQAAQVRIRCLAYFRFTVT